MITLLVEDSNGDRQPVEIPEDISLSLMELLKAYEYPIQATCGGMALCATCHVYVEKGSAQLSPAGDAELDMLDTLPDAQSNSRLACQIRVGRQLDGLEIRLAGSEQI